MGFSHFYRYWIAHASSEHRKLLKDSVLARVVCQEPARTRGARTAGVARLGEDTNPHERVAQPRNEVENRRARAEHVSVRDQGEPTVADGSQGL